MNVHLNILFFRFQMSYEVGRTATVEQLNQATRRYIAAAIDWIDALFSFANLMTVHEKVNASLLYNGSI